MKVTFFLDKYPTLSETFIQSQIDGLKSLGFDVSVITLFKGQGQLPDDLAVYSLYTGLPAKWRIVNIFRRLVSVSKNIMQPKVWSALLAPQYKVQRASGYFPALVADWDRMWGTINSDVVIAHFGTTAVTANMLQQLGLLQGKLLAVFHGFDLSERELVYKYSVAYKTLFFQATACLPISARWAEKLQLLGCPNNKIYIHRMGIDINNFSLLTFPELLSQPIKLLSVARLVEKKGLKDAILAVQLLKHRGIDVNYLILGDGPLFTELSVLIKDLDLSEQVTLFGRATHHEVNQYLSNCDVFLLPSKTAKNGDQEGIPVSLMEAMARGVICVSTFHSGIPELITHEVNGFLVNENSPEQLASVIEQLILRTDLIDIRINARRQISENYQKNVLNQKLAFLIQSLND